MGKNFEKTAEVNSDLLEKVYVIWQKHETASLKTRHAVGLLLVEELTGTQTNNRQPYGKRLVHQVADRLRISASEVSRMRKFANQFKTIEAFHTEYPEVRTWSEVKQSILTAPKKRADAATSVNHGVHIRQFVKRLKLTTERLNDLGSTPKPVTDDWRELQEAVMELTKAAGRVLGVQPGTSPEQSDRVLSGVVTSKVA